MKKSEYAFCESCANKKITRESGIVCGLTEQKPDFTGSCADYKFHRENFIYAYNSHNRNVLIFDVKKRFIHYLIDTFAWTMLAFYAMDSIWVITTNFWLILIGGLSIGFFGYFFLFEYFTGRTLGKYVTSTIVLDKTTFEKPKPWQFFVRSLFRLPIINTFDALMALMGEPLHDIASNTRVFKDDQESLDKALVLRDIKMANPNDTDFIQD